MNDDLPEWVEGLADCLAVAFIAGVIFVPFFL